MKHPHMQQEIFVSALNDCGITSVENQLALALKIDDGLKGPSENSDLIAKL